jgi:sialate O-acetylesterase
MVLQRGMPVPIWGWAKADEHVVVEFAGQRKETVAGRDGKWTVRLDPLRASSEGRALTIGDKRFSDVLVGEVWICSGQSNMEQTLGKRTCGYGGVLDGKEVMARADYPTLRHIKVGRGPWKVCSWRLSAPTTGRPNAVRGWRVPALRPAWPTAAGGPVGNGGLSRRAS